jgi:putative ABC transport system permease protein
LHRNLEQLHIVEFKKTGNMLKNFFTTILRNAWRNKATSLIHVLGLALGMATCLLILLFVRHELSYDRYNEKADRIYRVTFRGKMNGMEIKEAVTMAPVAFTLKKDYPEVEQATRLHADGVHKISYGTKTFKEDALGFVDSNFFQVFTLPFLKGDSRTALNSPNTAVITQNVAKKYFGNEDPIGKVLEFPDDHQGLKVTGLIADMPENSHFHFDVFASISSLPYSKVADWMSSQFYTYVVLPEGYDAKRLEAKMPRVVEQYIGPQLQKAMGLSIAQFRAGGNDLTFLFQPLTSIHLHSDLNGELAPGGDARYVYIFSAVGVFMLLIACINFMNLSTAGATKRAKEVGIRKVLGSERGQLIRQFLGESMVLTGTAMVIAAFLVYWALPLFNQLTGQNLQLYWSSFAGFLPALIAFCLITGLLAGSYPALYLSSFQPIAVLKGAFRPGGRGARLRSSLVVFQFFISISLIIGTMVVYRQLSFIRHKDVGYDRDQVMIIENTYGGIGDKQDLFRRELQRDPRVQDVASSSYIPAGESNGNNFLVFADTNTSRMINTLRYEVDDRYIPTLGMHLVAGRNFSPAFGADSLGIIINETAARTFGWIKPEDSSAEAYAQAPGHEIVRPEDNGTRKNYRVIGVVKDFHFKSLHQMITPLVMTLDNTGGSLIVKVKTKDLTGLRASMQQLWSGLNPQAPFSYSFLDDRFNNTYKTDVNVGRILGIFAGLTIFVACLGLFGLATFTAEQRMKEIGIRKVLGANTAGIVALLSRDFVRLVGFAFLIAAPVTWYLMNRWLQDFAYRIGIGWWMFAVAGALTLVITLLTISVQALRAATANPANVLHNE